MSKHLVFDLSVNMTEYIHRLLQFYNTFYTGERESPNTSKMKFELSLQ